MPALPALVKFLPVVLFALLTCGCATTYVPISWGFGEKVRQISRSDLVLVTLFERYDPERRTLRVAGDSFDQVMMPGEVKYHLGAYRPDTRLIYRNLFQDYSDRQLRSLMQHELAHHVWYTGMTSQQRLQWMAHLVEHPSPVQNMVRMVYGAGSDFDGEDFAFSVEQPRAVDIEALANIKVITTKERDAILKERFPSHPLLLAAGSDPISSVAHPAAKGPGSLP